MVEGWYCWCHDQVLRALADTAITNCEYQHTSKQFIAFVRAGEKTWQQPSPVGRLLTTTQDWKLQVDPGRQLKFPEYISATSLHPDMVLTSEPSKQVVVVELSVPLGRQNGGQWTQEGQTCQRNGWKARCEPVGSLGFSCQSLPHTFKLLRVKGQLCRRTGSRGKICAAVVHTDTSRGLITPN